MSSKIADKKIFHITVIIIGLLVFPILSLYVFAPSYKFYENQAFSGQFIYNPYQNIDNPDWNYVNLRSDSISNSDFVYEYGYGISPTHYLCVDYKEKRKIDYPLIQNIHHKQHNINCLNKTASLVIPSNIDKGFRIREMKYLDKYRLMEVLSSKTNALDYWDAALSSGHRVNILATNDKNIASEVYYSTIVNAKFEDKERMIESLKNGDSYAISYRKETKELPELKSFKLNNDSITIEASKEIKAVRFIGQGGMLKDSLSYSETACYIFKEDDTYIRTELYFDDETIIYLNPIVRHQYQYFFDLTLSEMMKEKTWLMRIVYVAMLIFLVKYFLQNIKVRYENKRRQNQ